MRFTSYDDAHGVHLECGSTNPPLMKTRFKRPLLVLGLALASYFALYLLSVRTDLSESHDQIVPSPSYRPFDADLVHLIFGPAQLIDATYLRPAHWEPRSVERNPRP